MLDTINWPAVGRLVGLAAVIALPSVVLIMMFGQTRVFFTMARDGLLPERLASVHRRFRTPHIVTVGVKPPDREKALEYGRNRKQIACLAWPQMDLHS